jgi:alkyl-hydroperoxide reductase/thiol specific antioxidant family protein
VQVQQAVRGFNDLDIQIVVVTFQPERVARQYAVETKLPWPVLIDEHRELYRAYGMGKARLKDLVGPTVWRAYFRELLRGVLPGWPQGDTQQQGGDVLIDPKGIVRVHHVGAGPADRPLVDDLLRVRQAGA